MVEMGLVLPLILFLVFCSFDFYQGIRRKIIVNSALLDAGRTGAITRYQSALCEPVVRSALESKLAEDGFQIELKENGGQVTAELPADALEIKLSVPNACIFCLGTKTVNVSGIFRMEREDKCPDRSLRFEPRI